MRSTYALVAAMLACLLALSFLPVLTVVWMLNPRFHPQATALVYRVDVETTVIGTEYDAAFGPPTTHTIVTEGSATAVSADGDLLTNRHVVDVTDYFPDVCEGRLRDPRRLLDSWVSLEEVSIHLVDLRVTASDGRQWRGTAIGTSEVVCDAQRRPILHWTEQSTATIVQVDSLTDLALLHITATGLPHLRTDRSKTAVGTPALAVGKCMACTRPYRFRWGAVGTCSMEPEGPPYPERVPLVAVTHRLQVGMSGGPVMSHGRLLGISAAMSRKPPYVSYVIPGPYAAAWYEWVRGISPDRPPAVCP